MTRILNTHTSQSPLLKTLRNIADENNPKISQLALLTQLAVYKDIVPGYVWHMAGFIGTIFVSNFLFIPVPNSYRIRQLTDKEEATQVSKDVKKVRSFEQSLLANYQAYLTDLERFSKCMYMLAMYMLASSSLPLQINYGLLLTHQFSETC